MKNCIVGATKCKELYCGSYEMSRIVLWELRNVKNCMWWELRNVKTCIVGATKCKELYCGTYEM